MIRSVTGSYRGKREMLSLALTSPGIDSMLRLFPSTNRLLVLNYHRIGDSTANPYDPTVFSATEAEFTQHMEFISRYTEPVELSAIVNGTLRASRRRTLVHVTFDDGYLDNYELAYPILRRIGIPASFYLPTAFIGTGVVPWWDAIAWMLKHTKKRSLRLEYPHPLMLDLESESWPRSLTEVLTLYKQPTMQDSDRFFRELEAALDFARPGADATRCFLNWDEARTMMAQGMSFGGHTHTHPILSQLTKDQQRDELSISRDAIARELGSAPLAIAYPVGMSSSFTRETETLAQELGYTAGFSFYGGVNALPIGNRYDIMRVAVSNTSQRRFQLQCSFGMALGHWWP